MTALLVAVFAIGMPLGAAALWVAQALTADDLDEVDQ